MNLESESIHNVSIYCKVAHDASNYGFKLLRARGNLRMAGEAVSNL